MELYQLLIQAGTGAIALYILYQFQRNVAASDARKDEAMKQERDRSQQNHQEFMLLYAQNTTMLATLAGKQVDTAAAVVASEKSVGAKIERVGEQVEGAEENILSVVAKMQKVFNTVFEMFMKDPPATAEQLDRFMEAINVGDVDKAKVIKDEVPKAPDISAAVAGEGKAIA